MRLEALTTAQRSRLQVARDDAARALVAKEFAAARAAIADETTARLAEEYENGALLDFFMPINCAIFRAPAFDIGNFVAEMVSGFDVAKETKRLSDAGSARATGPGGA